MRLYYLILIPVGKISTLFTEEGEEKGEEGGGEGGG